MPKNIFSQSYHSDYIKDSCGSLSNRIKITYNYFILVVELTWCLALATANDSTKLSSLHIKAHKAHIMHG